MVYPPTGCGPTAVSATPFRTISPTPEVLIWPLMLR